MTILSRRRLLFAAAAAALAIGGGAIALAPSGCASNCGSNCPTNTAVIETAYNVDPGITDLAFDGPACPTGRPGCRGDDQTTQCNHILVTGTAVGYCDLYIALAGREPMAVRLQFGPPPAGSCCKGYAVVGDWHFTIPLDLDAGIYGGDGSTDAVRPVRDGSADDATDGPAPTPDGADDDGGTD